MSKRFPTENVYEVEAFEATIETAHGYVERAVAAGRLVRPEACEICDEGRYLQAHHDDYNFPLRVRWLCIRCHRCWHAKHTPIYPEVKAISRKQMQENAEKAIKRAVKARLKWRGKKKTDRREQELTNAFDGLTSALQPIRKLNGKAIYKQRFYEPQLQQLSLDIQAEKKRLRKMCAVKTYSQPSL